MSRRGIAVLRLLGCLVALSLALVLTHWRLPVTFAVSSNAEQVRFETRAGPDRLTWYLADALVRPDYDAAEVRRRARVEIDPAVDVLVRRVGTGPVLVRLRAREGATRVGTLHDEVSDSTFPLGAAAVIRIDRAAALRGRGVSVVLPLVGRVMPGPPAWDADSIMPVSRGGGVSLLGHSLLSRQRYEGGHVDLDRGDEFVVTTPEGPAYGAIEPADAGLSLTYRVVGRDGQVNRFGSYGFEVGLSGLDRVRHDGLVQGAWAALLFLLGLPRLIPSFSPRDTMRRARRRSRRRSTMVALLSLHLLPLAPAAARAQAQAAYITDGQAEGQGVLLRNARGQCMTVVPNHVVKAPESLRATVGPAQTTTATVAQAYVAEDLAILLLAPQPWLQCGPLQRTDLTSVLEQPSVPVTIMQRNGLGQLTRIGAMVETNDAVALRLAPTLPGQVFAEGMSGSPLYLANGTLLGVVRSIQPGTNRANAVRADHLLSVVEPFVTGGARPWYLDSLSADDARRYLADLSGDYAAGSEQRIRIARDANGQYQGVALTRGGRFAYQGLYTPPGEVVFRLGEPIGQLRQTDAREWSQSYSFSVIRHPDPDKEDEQRYCRAREFGGASGIVKVSDDPRGGAIYIEITLPEDFIVYDGERRCSTYVGSSATKLSMRLTRELLPGRR